SPRPPTISVSAETSIPAGTLRASSFTISASTLLALLVKSVAPHGSAGCKPALIPVPAHGVAEPLRKADCGAPKMAWRLAFGPGAPVGMQNLAGLFRSEHGCAAQNLCSSQADRGGGPYSPSRQTDHESLGIQGRFGGPDNLIPGI